MLWVILVCDAALWKDAVSFTCLGGSILTFTLWSYKLAYDREELAGGWELVGDQTVEENVKKKSFEHACLGTSVQIIPSLSESHTDTREQLDVKWRLKGVLFLINQSREHQFKISVM